jgi:hypothetical protein
MARPYLFHSLKSLKTTMGSMMTAAHTAIITQGIVNRHTLVGTRNGLQTRLEDAIVDTLSKNTPNIYVHWGVHLSGKHRAAKNAAIRLQGNGNLCMHVQGWDFTHKPNVKDWLRGSIGIPHDRAGDALSTFLPADKKPSLILGNLEFFLKKFGATALVEGLHELDIPVLILTRSWEYAVDLNKEGCGLLREPGFGRWTEEELNDLYQTFPEEIKQKVGTNKLSLMEAAVHSASPGILEHECKMMACKPDMLRARLMRKEWQNGMRALQGQDMGDITGRFPDKDGTFHWDQ